jgi:ceramide glucosyltransferase
LLILWQWLAAIRFPVHRRLASRGFAPPVTLLKPLKGADHFTYKCLRSWFDQDYPGAIQLLFAVASADDPVCEVVRGLQKEFPKADAQLIVCSELRGANLKVSKLAQIEVLARHEVVVVSDADVWAPPDLLSQAVLPLESPETGLVNCFYRLANPQTAAMRWEALAVNADFWSQVLQSCSLKPMDFALGAVMTTRRKQLAQIGGFAALQDCLADDYQLGHRIARQGNRIALCPVVVECWSDPMGWGAVWRHQLRWARTIRVCQPGPYFFSILSNGTLWPLIWAAVSPSPLALGFGVGAVLTRVMTALDLRRRLAQSGFSGSGFWLIPLKDLLQGALWAASFAGNRVEWRGEKMRLSRGGELVRPQAN